MAESMRRPTRLQISINDNTSKVATMRFNGGERLRYRKAKLAGLPAAGGAIPSSHLLRALPQGALRGQCKGAEFLGLNCTYRDTWVDGCVL